MAEPHDNCPLCGSAAATHVIDAVDYATARPGTVTYVRCADCGLVREDPMPTPAEIPGLYPDDYEPHEQVDRAHEERRLKRRANRLAVRWHYGVDAPRRPLPQRLLGRLIAGFTMPGTLVPHGACRLLDVGCGSGAWLLRHQLLGWETAGVELVPAAAEAARELGLDVRTGDIDTAPTGPWDVIAFRHVIEHVPDPVTVIRRAVELLAPGGMIFILTPNIESWGFARFGLNWFPLQAPCHLVLWSPATIRRLAAECGLTVRRVETERQAKMISQSRLYERVWGDDGPGLSPDERRARGQRCRDLVDDFLHADKPYRKAAAPRTWWHALTGRGETLHAELSGP